MNKMNKFRKIVWFTIELLVSPFMLLFRTANVIPNPNKIVKPIILMLVSIVVVTLIILYIYREVIFQ